MAEEIFAVFTEDQAATQAIVCQRQECGRQIQPNDPRFNIRNQNVNGKSKTVCRDCRAHYLAAPLTIRKFQSHDFSR
jgi:hypothetical protein